MTAKKIITLILASAFFLVKADAQVADYSAQWKKIEGLEKKGLTKSALQEVMVIYNLAIKDGNDAQQIKSCL